MHTLARSSRLAVAGLLACVFAACAPQSGDAGAANQLALLEQLAFVPQGRVPAAALTAAGANSIALAEPLLVGMYEVTRAEFERHAAQAATELDPLLLQRLESWDDTQGALPASFMTRDEAAQYARSLGMRLLTCREWLFCALSPRVLAYPWADAWQQGRANTLDLELEHRAPTPVGTFEGGRTSTHIYDLLGNVAEWGADDLFGSSAADASATALGGSFLTYRREMYREGTFFAESLHPAARFDDLGFRVCANARAWLEARAAELGRAPNARARLEAIGRRWGNSAAPLLGELAARAAAGAERLALESLRDGARR